MSATLPSSRRDEVSRTVAAFFAFEAGIGGIPGAAGAWVLLKMSGAYGGAPNPVGVILFTALMGFILSGFALLAFYVRRAAGQNFANESTWWHASLIYNAVLLVASTTWGPWAPLGVLWFTTLCGLSWWAWRASTGGSHDLA